ncbi:MAG: histidine phosphatase family protein [Kiritimatiellae bacterium]|nr:histidine phosphatase family protein [Kiritimatiellia bacterium]
MKVYLMRHGETPWNREKKIQGSTEWVDLTDSGVDLAVQVRDRLVQSGVSFDRIFASPLKRALHTAEIVASAFGMLPQKDERLQEMAFGRYEGTRMLEGFFEDDNIRACFKDPEAFVPQGGESFDEVLARARDFFEQAILPLEGKAERVLVVSHGAFMRSAIRYITNRPLKDYWQGVQPNCCVHILEVLGGKTTVKELSRVF